MPDVTTGRQRVRAVDAVPARKGPDVREPAGWRDPCLVLPYHRDAAARPTDVRPDIEAVEKAIADARRSVAAAADDDFTVIPQSWPEHAAGGRRTDGVGTSVVHRCAANGEVSLTIGGFSAAPIRIGIEAARHTTLGPIWGDARGVDTIRASMLRMIDFCVLRAGDLAAAMRFETEREASAVHPGILRALTGMEAFAGMAASACAEPVGRVRVSGATTWSPLQATIVQDSQLAGGECPIGDDEAVGRCSGPPICSAVVTSDPRIVLIRFIPVERIHRPTGDPIDLLRLIAQLEKAG